jgi:hypothetical protein
MYVAEDICMRPLSALKNLCRGPVSMMIMCAYQTFGSAGVDVSVTLGTVVYSCVCMCHNVCSSQALCKGWAPTRPLLPL